MIKIAKQINFSVLQCICRATRFSSSLSLENYSIKPERIEQISKSPSGWVPRADPAPELPFDIERSKTNNIPVYVKYSHGRIRQITTVRKVRGDIKELEKCVRERLGNDNHYQINELTNQLHIKGNHRDKVIRLLKELGF